VRAMTRLDRVATVQARIGWKALTADEYVDDGHIFLATPNIKGRDIDFENVNYISTFRYEESPELKLQLGDVLLAKDGSTLGIANYVRHLPGPATVNGSIAVVRPHGVEPSFLTYWLQGRFIQSRIQELKDGMGVPHLFQQDIRKLPVPDLEPVEQRRIADFLDDRIARIDRIIAARRDQMDHASAASLRDSFDTVRGSSHSERRPSGLKWLKTIPSDWALHSVTAEFQVDLGKMLDEKRQFGLHAIPYLRNTNVQWDRIDLEDLKSMDIAPEERPRYTVEPGDLLICEGGQPGRAAIWPGGLEPLGFQKALHRARSRGSSRPEWLLECLRAATAMNVFAVEYGQATISHLTNEQLRSFKIPCPEQTVQDELLAQLRITQERARLAIAGFARSIDLLNEYKQSLISAAVTGELDVTTATSGIAG